MSGFKVGRSANLLTSSAFTALSKGGTVTMPVSETFFAKFGMVTDRFGTPWMINPPEGDVRCGWLMVQHAMLRRPHHEG